MIVSSKTYCTDLQNEILELSVKYSLSPKYDTKDG